MLICLAACHKDYGQCLNWADWIREIGSDYSRHSALVVGSSTIASDDVGALATKFRTAGFKHVTAIQAKTEATPSWPNGANAMWRLAADWVKDNAKVPWLWCESDAIPTQPGWINTIESEYLSAKKAFLGTIYPIPFKHLNGVGVFPPAVRRFNPAMFNSEFFNLPFDCVRPDLTLRDAHITRLFCRSLADPSTNTAHSFPDEASLSVVPPDCVMFHGCKDGSLIQRLREIANPELKTTLQAAPATLGEKIASGWRKLTGGHPRRFYHSGNLGDISYALSAIKSAGGGDLVIGPQQRQTALCAVPVDKKQFEMALPLWREQKYLKSIEFSPAYPVGCRDLNHFRNWWNNRQMRNLRNIQTLRECHFFELGILDEIDHSPWIQCGKPIETRKLVVHRSPRYNSPGAGAEAFPWQRLVSKYFAEMLFIGLESEHEAFCRTFGKRVSFWRVSDFLEMAKLIKGARCCCMNQSFPLSLAIGMGQRVYVEAISRSPDCRVPTDNYQDQLQMEIPEEL